MPAWVRPWPWKVDYRTANGRPAFTHAVQLRTFIVSILCRLWRGYDHSKIPTGGQPLEQVKVRGRGWPAPCRRVNYGQDMRPNIPLTRRPPRGRGESYCRVPRSGSSGGWAQGRPRRLGQTRTEPTRVWWVIEIMRCQIAGWPWMAGECGERDKTGWRLQITVRTREGEIIHTNERILCVIGNRQRRNSSGKQGNRMDCVPRCPPPPPPQMGIFRR